MTTPSALSEIDELLEYARRTMHDGWTREIEAQRDRAVALVIGLSPAHDDFILDRLAAAFALTQHDTEGSKVCDVFALAFETRPCVRATPILARMLRSERCAGWLRRQLASLLARWDARANVGALRAAARAKSGFVRCIAAECMVANRVATRADVDAFFRDPDESVRKLALRGLHGANSSDAIARCWDRARNDPSYKVREWARFYLTERNVVPPLLRQKDGGYWPPDVDYGETATTRRRPTRDRRKKTPALPVAHRDRTCVARDRRAAAPDRRRTAGS